MTKKRVNKMNEKNSKPIRTIEDIESDWLDYLEKKLIKVRRKWFEPTLDCDKPEFVPHAKAFYKTLSKQDRLIIEADRVRASRDFFYYNSYSRKSFMKLYYSYKKLIKA